jgi:hypothetical protein
MYSILRVFLGFAILSLVACANQNGSFLIKKDLSRCKKVCFERFKLCHSSCVDNCRHCTQKANSSAGRHYRQYQQQQEIQGGTVARELKSYRDPLQCRKTTCNCEADYSVCRQSCTGIINKRLQVGPACC